MKLSSIHLPAGRLIEALRCIAAVKTGDQMFACNLRSMKLPLSRTLGGFVSSYASVVVSALSLSTPTLQACKCDAREVTMSTSARHTHSNGSARSQRQVRCGGSSNCGNGISNFTQCLITCGLLLLLAAGNGKSLCVFPTNYLRAL